MVEMFFVIRCCVNWLTLFFKSSTSIYAEVTNFRRMNSACTSYCASARLSEDFRLNCFLQCASFLSFKFEMACLVVFQVADAGAAMDLVKTKSLFEDYFSDSKKTFDELCSTFGDVKVQFHAISNSGFKLKL